MAGMISSMHTNIGSLPVTAREPIIFVPTMNVEAAELINTTYRGANASETCGREYEAQIALRDAGWRAERKPEHFRVAQPKLMRFIPPVYNSTYHLDAPYRPVDMASLPYNAVPPAPVSEDNLRNPFKLDMAGPNLVTVPKTAHANLQRTGTLYTQQPARLESAYTPIKRLPHATYPLQGQDLREYAKLDSQLLQPIPKARLDISGAPPAPNNTREPAPKLDSQLLQPIPKARLDISGAPPAPNNTREPAPSLQPERRVYNHFRVDARPCKF